MSYPTRKEILDNLTAPNEGAVKLLKEWTKSSWKLAKTNGEQAKINSLKVLINYLAKIYKKPVRCVYEPEASSCCYNIHLKTIFLNNSLSILSSLHEFGHHLHGSSELSACTWSVSLFKVALPKAYSKLKWKGHLLIRR